VVGEPDEEDRGVDGVGMLDADRFLTFAERLHAARERIEAASIGDRRRAQWQRLLIAVSAAAQQDLEGAERQLTRLEAELDRRLD
jgi:hypothetical protein